MMQMMFLIEEVEKSGRKRVGEVQQEEERRLDKAGLNSARRYLLVCISFLSPLIIVRSAEIDLMASSIISL